MTGNGSTTILRSTDRGMVSQTGTLEEWRQWTGLPFDGAGAV
jgi:hypothetical protein